MADGRVTFDQLGLSAPILRAVAEAGYDAPTPIQRDAIPPALRGRDILGCAQTGTGKTAAFCLPLLQRVDARADDDPKIRALVVTPTRELAAQIGASIETYGKHLEDLWHTVIFGGVKERPQIQELRQGIDVLVATPGRLLDLMNRGFLTLDDEGGVVLAACLDAGARAALGIDGSLQKASLTDAHRAYLTWHRKRVFRGTAGPVRPGCSRAARTPSTHPRPGSVRRTTCSAGSGGRMTTVSPRPASAACMMTTAWPCCRTPTSSTSRTCSRAPDC